MKSKTFVEKFTLTALLILFMPLVLVLADMGAIVPVETVSIDEPAQRAIIGFDGFEEVLILQTEIEISKSSRVLRFIPLPSKPEIKPGSNSSFKELKKIISSHNLKYFMRYKSISSAPGGSSINIVIRKTIGAHNITVAYFNSFEDFVLFIKKEMHGWKMFYDIENNYDLRDIVNHYLKNNIKYFVFDIVNVDKKSIIAPVVYKFQTRSLYYPLVATNILKSYGTIELFIFSETGRYYLSSAYGFIPSTTARVKSEEFKKIDPILFNILGENAILQAFKYKGKLHFENDINESSCITEININGNK